MTPKLSRFTAVFLFCSMLLVACAPAATPAPTAAPTSEPTTVATTAPSPTPEAPQPTEALMLSVKDASGTEIKLEKPAERIVCIITACIDLLANLQLLPVGALVGDGITLAADTRYFGENAQKISPISGGFFEPNIEEIAALKPDLIIGYSGDHDLLRDSLKTIAPLYLFDAKPSFRNVFTHLQQLATLTGRTSQADAAIKAFDEKLSMYQQKITTRTKAFILVSSGLDDIEVSTDQTPSGSLMAQIAEYPWPLPAGAENYGGDLPFSLEKIIEVNPDVIFVETVTYGSDTVTPMSEQLAEKPIWKDINAVKNGKVYEVNPRIWNAGAGPISLGIVLDEAIALLYPELAPKP